jgi:hypothetical protein
MPFDATLTPPTMKIRANCCKPGKEIGDFAGVLQVAENR